MTHIAHFHDGPWHGRTMAIEELLNYIHVPVMEHRPFVSTDDEMSVETSKITYQRSFSQRDDGGWNYWVYYSMDRPVTRCLSVQPGVIDFPPRCRRRADHAPPHRSFGEHAIEWEDSQ